MAERSLIVFIYLPGETIAVPAGVFYHDGDAGVGRFVYGRKYVERLNAMPVDPVALPLGVEPREVVTNEGFYGAFADAAPDYWGRLVIAAEKHTVPETLSTFDFLAAGGATRVGNLDFRDSPTAPEPALGLPQFSDLADILQAADGIAEGVDVDQRLLRLLRQGTSVGGARPKCTVQDSGQLWLAKFPAREDRFPITVLEYATMEFARLCGIRVPDTRLVDVGGASVYLVKRFDRQKKGAQWRRTGFLSCLSFMEWDQRDRLLWSYPAVAARMRRYMKVEFLHEWFRRMVFNILVRNTDDHPKNHGFLCRGNEMELAPAYDLVPALTTAGVGTDFRLAMSVGASGRDASIDNAVSQAEQFGLSQKMAGDMVVGMKTVCKQWARVYREAGLSPRQIETLSPSMRNCDL